MELRKRLRHRTELGKYSHLEEVRVLRVSYGRLYHDHLETKVGKIAARQDLDLAGPDEVQRQDRVVRAPKNKVCANSQEAEGGRGEAGSSEIKTSDEVDVVRMVGQWWKGDASHDAQDTEVMRQLARGAPRRL